MSNMRKWQIFLGILLILSSCSLFVSLLTASPSGKHTAAVRTSAKKVLGAYLLADDAETAGQPVPASPAESTPPVNSPEDHQSESPNVSAPAQTPAAPAPVVPTDTPSPAQTDVQTSAPLPTPAAAVTPTDALPPTTPTDAPTSTEHPQEVSPGKSDATPVQDAVPPTVSPAANQPAAEQPEIHLLDTESVREGLEVSEEIARTVEQEDRVLSAASTPEQHTEHLITFAGKQFDMLDHTVQARDYTSTAFALQRLNSQLVESQQNIRSVSPTAQATLRRALQQVCLVSSDSLRLLRFQVPESLAQDVAITQGTCHAINK